jgi:hypothetical protein
VGIVEKILHSNLNGQYKTKPEKYENGIFFLDPIEAL